jgi:arylsulfatase A-like enzyme
VPTDLAIRKQAQAELAGYYAHIEATDRAIGRLLAEVSADTVVVFTSVHGDMHGAHGLFRKGWPHEESVRVPLLIRANGRLGAPGINPTPVSLLDLPAMARAWAREQASPPLAPVTRISMPSVVALPHQCDRVWSGIRSATRKEIFNPDGTPWLIFDLENDPYELRNLIGSSSP